MRARLSIAAFLLAACVAQDPLRAQRFSSRTLGVRVDVLVMNGGKPLAGLSAADFELRDNGVLQKVEVVGAADVPINVMLALDTSASIAGRERMDLVSAGESVLDGLRSADRAALTTFSHAVTPAIRLTGDLQAVRGALRDVRPHGRTSVMDGAYVALASTLDETGRFLLLVCTDGADTMSWLKTSDVLDAAARANAVVYAVTSNGGRSSEPLEQLADATGGQILQVKSSGDLRPAFQRILTEFRARYVLAYEPAGVEAGGYHRLEVTVPRRRAVVKARTGYIGLEASRPR